METKNTATNFYGIRIIKCCASCLHKTYTNNPDLRNCLKGEKGVKPSYLCPEWQMSWSLTSVGKGDGRVKKASYLKYVFDHVGKMKLNEIQNDFEEIHGTRFLIK